MLPDENKDSILDSEKNTDEFIDVDTLDADYMFYNEESDGEFYGYALYLTSSHCS